jgi:hypothetical protein
MISQVVVGTTRLDTIEQIGHDPTGMLQMVAVEAKSRTEGTPPLLVGLDRFFETTRELGEVESFGDRLPVFRCPTW